MAGSDTTGSKPSSTDPSANADMGATRRLQCNEYRRRALYSMNPAVAQEIEELRITLQPQQNDTFGSAPRET